MTDPQIPTAAGWYPDPHGQAPTRWWDGQAWTSHLGGPAQQGYAPAARRAEVPPQTSVDTPYIWVVVLAPILSYAGLFFWHPDLSLDALERNPFAILGVGYFVLLGVSWLAYAALVVFAFLDRRELVRRGVDRPFHWAWTFLNAGIYVIGRYVILRPIAQKRGFTPLLIWIIVSALGFVASLVWSVIFTVEITQSIGSIPGMNA